MKKVIVILTSAYLIFLFLLYCGVFSNDRKPENVTRYYYDYIRNGEWFLTYQICEPSYFDAEKIVDEYRSHKLYRLERIGKIDVLLIKEDHTSVGVELVYKNKEKVRSIVELEMIEGSWLIKDIKYL